MKHGIHIYGFLLFFFLPVCMQAQLAEPAIQEVFRQAADTAHWDKPDYKEWRMTDQYTDSKTQLTYTYVQQYYLGVPVRNAISVLLSRGEKVLYFHPGLISAISRKVESNEILLGPDEALQQVLASLQLRQDVFVNWLAADQQQHHYITELPELASSPVQVQLVYEEVDGHVVLAWDVSLEMKMQPHWWNIRIDAVTGEEINRNDYTVQCMPSGTGNGPTGALPAYRVFALPVESPTFGSRSLQSNPSSMLASPFGWHDVNGIAGEEYTITRGNNVYAYEDMNNDNLPGYSPDAGSALLFDYPFVFGGTQLGNEDASITNLFYTCNKVHDYLYAFSFNEAAGNFQVNNYGNTGLANDAVKAEAMDGGGLNNANFSTPPDGNAGRMQMYLWTGNPSLCSTLAVSSNTLNGTMNVGVADFTATGSVSAQLILANDGVGVATDACSSLINNVAGKIVLIDRGTCNYINKAQTAQSAGAVAVIIANNISGAPQAMTGTPALSIPVISVSLTDGNSLKLAMLNGVVNVSVTTCTVNPVDGAFDNGIIAHEYGHGLSNRLTGGPSQASCLTNVEQGGEGWSDWLALMMTIEPGDHGTDARGMGTYALSQPVSGPGIRRYPYSTNMSINPQTYASLATSAGAHQIGEIWCDVLWDMSWKLIDQYGFSNDPANVNAGNNIAMRLVVEGMKLQPCNPGFLDARDGILTAEALLYNNVHRCLLWQAFAGRGMGYNAQQGSANAVGDEVAGFAMPPFCQTPTQQPVAAFTADSLSISCGKSVHFTDQSVQAFNWNWDFGDGQSSVLQHPVHVFSTPGTYHVKLVVTNPLGTDSIFHNISVLSTFTVNVSTSANTICGGSPVTLNAQANGSTSYSYQVAAIPYSPLPTTGTTVSLGDDQMSTALPIGFNFSFFGLSYSSFYICSNGFITFSAGMPANVVYGEPLPGSGNPNNLIALAWNDLNPTVSGSSIKYNTIGTAPNRKLVVSYSTWHYLSNSLPFVVQVILYEGSNQIEIHTTIISDASGFDSDAMTTQGVENADGTRGVAVPGRNSTSFAASQDAYRFTPYIPYTWIWTPGNLNGNIQIVQPMSSTSYTLQVSDGTPCTLSIPTPLIQVQPCPVTLTIHALIEGYYVGGGMMQPVLMNQGIGSNALACDSMKLVLHQSVFPYTTVASHTDLLSTDGTVSSTFNVLPGPYYIELQHRNAVQVWSATPVWFTGSGVTYDFRDAATKAYGGDQRPVGNGWWALYSGDLNGDENVDLLDHSLIEADILNFGFGYFSTDLNGDGNVDLLDMPILEGNIINFIYAMHP